MANNISAAHQLAAVPNNTKFSRESMDLNPRNIELYHELVRENAANNGVTMPLRNPDTIDYEANAKKNKDKSLSNMGIESVIKLMLASVKYQDPSDPMSSKDMGQQVANLAVVSSIKRVEQSTEAMQKSAEKIASNKIGKYVGHDVTVQNDNFAFKFDQPPKLGFNLMKNAQNASISILDSRGVSVKKITMENQLKPGNYSILWDGRNNSGHPVPEGKYTFKVNAFDQNGATVNTLSHVTGTLNGYDPNNNEHKMIVGGYVYDINKDFMYGTLDNALKPTVNNVPLQQIVQTLPHVSRSIPDPRDDIL